MQSMEIFFLIIICGVTMSCKIYDNVGTVMINCLCIHSSVIWWLFPELLCTWEINTKITLVSTDRDCHSSPYIIHSTCRAIMSCQPCYTANSTWNQYKRYHISRVSFQGHHCHIPLQCCLPFKVRQKYDVWGTLTSATNWVGLEYEATGQWCFI